MTKSSRSAPRSLRFLDCKHSIGSSLLCRFSRTTPTTIARFFWDLHGAMFSRHEFAHCKKSEARQNSSAPRRKIERYRRGPPLTIVSRECSMHDLRDFRQSNNRELQAETAERA